MAAADPVWQPKAAVSLAPWTTIGIGGAAQWFAEAASVDDVALAHRWCADRNLPLFVMGGGSNVIVADKGVDGLVLRVAVRGVRFGAGRSETTVRVGAGEPWDEVVQATVARGLAGLECLSGIPGSAGGTPIQNVGAYGQEVSSSITDVVVFDRSVGRVATLSKADCGFGYRTSRFKGRDIGRFVVCEVGFSLHRGGPTTSYPDVTRYLEEAGTTAPALRDIREAVLAIRRRKGMVLDEADPDTRSVGSFFLNPSVSPGVHADLEAAAGAAVPGFRMPDDRIKVPAAWLIERAGFKRGHRAGRVAVSSKHPLALVNLGGATAREVLQLATQIKRKVADQFGILLVPEPVFVGFDDDEDVAYLTGRRG